MADAHQELIDGSRSFAAFVNRPDDQRLSAAEVARGEDAGATRHVVAVGFDVPAAVDFEAEIGNRSGFFRPDETHREQHKLAGPNLLRAVNFLVDVAALFILPPFDAHGDEAFYIAVRVA